LVFIFLDVLVFLFGVYIFRCIGFCLFGVYIFRCIGFCLFGVYIFRCIGFCLPHFNLVDGCVLILVNRVLGLVVVPEEGSGLFTIRSVLF